MKSTTIILFLCLFSIVFSDTKIFQGKTSSDWTNSSSWSPTGIPTSTDSIVISNINELYVPNGITIAYLSFSGTGSKLYMTDVNITGNLTLASLSVVVVNGTVEGTGFISGGNVEVVGGNVQIDIDSPEKIVFSNGGIVAKLVNPKVIEGTSGDPTSTPSIDELVVGIDIGVPADKVSSKGVTVNTLTTTAPLSIYFQLVVSKEFTLRHLIKAYRNIYFKQNFKWDSGNIQLTDCNVNFESTVVATATVNSRSIQANIPSQTYFKGGLDFTAASVNSLSISNGKVYISSPVSTSITLDAGQLYVESQSTFTAGTVIFAPDVEIKAAVTIPELTASTLLTVSSSNVVITVLNSPPQISASAGFSVGTFLVETNLTIDGGSVITVTKYFESSASGLNIVGNLEFSSSSTANFTNTVYLTLDGLIKNQGDLHFLKGLEGSLKSTSAIVNERNTYFDSTSSADVRLTFAGGLGGRVVNLGLFVATGFIHFYLDSVPFYQCPTGEYEVIVSDNGDFGSALFPVDSVFRGQVTLEFSSAQVVNSLPSNNTILSWVRSDRNAPIGNAKLVVEVAGAPVDSNVGLLCLDPNSDPAIGIDGRAFLKFYVKSAPTNVGLCEPFLESGIKGDSYCPFESPAPADIQPVIAPSKPPSTTGTPTGPPSSASTIGIATSLMIVALNLVF